MSRALVIAVALAAGACRDPRLAELESIKKEVCACQTAACGEAAIKRVPAGGDQPDQPDHRAQKIARAMLECLHKLYLLDRPSTDPDAPAAGSSAPGAAAP